MKTLERNGMPRVLLLAVVLVVPVFAFGQGPTTAERVAAFKQSLAKNQVDLRKYQWIETTTVSYKGEVKSVKQNSCYYGADGKVQKTLISTPPVQVEQSSGRGGRLKGKIVANKKEEMTDYMQQAVALVGQYVPPDPALVKYSKETNNIQVGKPDANGVISINIPNFIKIGDMLAALLNVKNNTIVSVNVATYVDQASDTVTLAVTFARLTDGTSFTSRSVLDAKSKNVSVLIENSGHRPL